MLRTVHPPQTLSLLDFLAPSLICRRRALSSSPIPRTSTSQARSNALQHRKMRDKIMEQAYSRQLTPDSLKVAHNEALVELKIALRDQDLVRALTIWKQFKEKRETTSFEGLYQIPGHVLAKISSLYSTQLQNILSNEDSDIQNVARDFALCAADHDVCDALFALMFDHIVRNQPQAAIDLYAIYHGAIQKPVEEDTQDSHSENGLVFSKDEDDQAFNPGRVSLLLAVTAAHAMKNSFHDALDTYLQANIRPSTFRTLTLLRKLDYDAELKEKTKEYIHQLGLASLVSRPFSLSKHVMNLSSPSSVKLLEQLYNDVIRAISGPNPYLAIDESSKSATTPIAMTEAGWTAFQTGFLKSERPDLAAKIWQDMKDLGFTPGVSMWTALIDTYADLRDSKQAMLTWNMMLESGVKPDTLCYRAIITALFDDNNADAALQKFKEYHNTQDQSDLVIYIYNTVIKALLRLKRVKDVNTLMDVMRSKGPAPDIISYNTLLAYYCRQQDFKGLSEVFSQMSADGISGDVVSFSTILTALLAAGRTNAGSTVLSLMRKQGIKPNVATYSVIIDHQMRQGTEESLSEVLSMLDKMEQDESTKPNEVTFTSILAGLYRTRAISNERANEIKNDIIERMKRTRVSFRVPTYHILIRAALDSEDPKGYLDAIALLDEMERQSLPRTNTVWYILFAGLMHRGLWNVAKVMVEKMEQSGHTPSPRLLRLVNDIKQK